MNENTVQNEEVRNPPIMEETVPPITIWHTEDELVDNITYPA